MMTAKDSDGCASRIAIVLVCVLVLVGVSFFRGRGDAPSGADEGPREGWNKGGPLVNKLMGECVAVRPERLDAIKPRKEVPSRPATKR